MIVLRSQGKQPGTVDASPSHGLSVQVQFRLGPLAYTNPALTPDSALNKLKALCPPSRVCGSERSCPVWGWYSASELGYAKGIFESKVTNRSNLLFLFLGLFVSLDFRPCLLSDVFREIVCIHQSAVVVYCECILWGNTSNSCKATEQHSEAHCL